MLRTVFLAIFIVVWLIVATYVGILVLFSTFRRRQVSAPFSPPMPPLPSLSPHGGED